VIAWALLARKRGLVKAGAAIYEPLLEGHRSSGAINPKLTMKILSMFFITAVCAVAQGWSPSQEAPKLPLVSFVLPVGLEITPWAVSPQLFNPTNLDIDQKGRIWVTEGVNYRYKAGRQQGGDRIVILEDTDGDGKADRSRVF